MKGRREGIEAVGKGEARTRQKSLRDRGRRVEK